MLKSITLENYRCFKNETTIDVAPLTVLCGVNSSGKSSILKSLLMMKQTVEKESPYNKLSFMGNYVDNGYWEDIINSDSVKDDRATFTLSYKFVLNNYNPSQNRQDIPSYKEIKKLYSFVREADIFEIKHTIIVKKHTPNDARNPFEAYIGNNNVIKSRIDVIVKDKQEETIPYCTGYVSIEKVGNTERDYLLNYYNIPFDNAINSIPYADYKCKCYFSNIKLTNLFREKITLDVVRAKSTILSLYNIASMQYSGFNFIAPLRQHPMRNYIIKGDVNSVGISGEDMPILLAKNQNDKRINDIPLPRKNEENNFLINFTPETTKGISFVQRVQKWMDYFELGKLDISGNSGLLSININNHNIADVGFGISQILPIIVQGLYMQKDSTLLLEQPEIHLHPKMQMNMADFLLAVASSERNIIVETHSDHIINRLVRRAMENENIRKNICIYFIDKRNDKPNIEKVKIDEIDGAVCKYDDFFYQFASETENIIDIGYKNLQRKQEGSSDV